MFGFVVADEVHPQPYILVFGNRKKKIFFTGEAHQFTRLHHRFGEAASRDEIIILIVEHGSTVH